MLHNVCPCVCMWLTPTLHCGGVRIYGEFPYCVPSTFPRHCFPKCFLTQQYTQTVCMLTAGNTHSHRAGYVPGTPPPFPTIPLMRFPNCSKAVRSLSQVSTCPPPPPLNPIGADSIASSALGPHRPSPNNSQLHPSKCAFLVRHRHMSLT